MRLCVAMLISVFCLALTANLPEAQDRAEGQSQPAEENFTTVAARQQALAWRLKSARELRQANDLLKAAQLLNQAGHLQLALNLPNEALATFEENRRLAEQAGNHPATVDAFNGIAAAYIHSDACDEATIRLQRAIALSEQNNYREGSAAALILTAECQNHTNHALALKTAQEALALWQAVGDNRGIIRSHINIATYQLAQNSLEEATRSSEIAQELSAKMHFVDLEAEARINQGFIEFRKGAWQNVINFLRLAEELIDKEAEPFKATQISNGLGEAYMESGLPEAGLPFFQEALEYIRKTKNPRNITATKWVIGRALYFSQNYPEALAILQEVLTEAESQKKPVVMAMCHDYLGRTYDALNDRGLALQHLQTALDLYSKATNPMEVARTRGLIGQVHEKIGHLEEARAFYQQAMQTFDALSDRVNQSATLFALGRLEMKSGNYQTAENYLRQSIEVTENMRRMSTSRDLTAAFSATVHDRYEYYIHSLMRIPVRTATDSPTQSRMVLAFETSESARARSLTEWLRETDTNLLANADPELSKQERALRQSLRVREDERVSLLKGKHEKQELEKLDAELERLGTEYKKVVATINARYPAYQQLTQPQSWNLSRIQKEIITDDQTVLLEYFLGSEKSYVWAVTRNGFTSNELPSETVINKAVETLYGLLKVPANPDIQTKVDQTARELAQMILSPVADQLNKQRIIVAADGALNYIPFQILPVTATAEPLVAQHEIINAPSASILGDLRREAARRGVRQKVLAAFGNPVFAQPKQNEQIATTRSIEIKGDAFDPATMGRLFYSGREIANLREVASEEQTFAATEYDATRDQLLGADLTQYAVLHFATHGLLDPKRPENSGLLLSTINRNGETLNGFVGLQDVYSLRAPVDLVVLSACQTGLGKDIRGEGLIGLTRGFMYAGATSVVASLWKVEDEATAELMKRFYTGMLKNGKTPAEALRLAQNSIRQKPEWSAPHYWAAFTLQGEYHYVVNSSRGWQAYRIVLLVVGLLMVCGVCAFLWRRYSTSNK